VKLDAIVILLSASGTLSGAFRNPKNQMAKKIMMIMTPPKAPPIAPPSTAALGPEDCADGGGEDVLVADEEEKEDEGLLELDVMLALLVALMLATNVGTAGATAPIPVKMAPGVTAGVFWTAFAALRKAVKF